MIFPGVEKRFKAARVLANGLAMSPANQNMQYPGLILYLLLEAVIFTLILYIAAHYSSSEVIPTAGILTRGIFGGFSLIVFTTKKDFSFLGGILKIGFMVALASGAILYDSSRIMNHYASNQYVAASLQLFASVALLFWYILQIVMSFSRR